MFLGSVLGTTLIALGNAIRIQYPTYNFVTDTGEIAHFAASNQYD
jgi:hypothetical protein